MLHPEQKMCFKHTYTLVDALVFMVSRGDTVSIAAAAAAQPLQATNVTV